MDRRKFIAGASGAFGLGALTGQASAQQTEISKSGARPGNPIAVSTYSFWRFLDDSHVPVDRCIELAAEMGFDAVEILEMQMQSKDAATVRQLKRLALVSGLALCSLSTHQGFVSPDVEKRKQNIAITLASIELAYQLGIPTVRVNTGRWGTSGTFDDLMKMRGIESPLPGHTEAEAFDWVVDSFAKCLPTAEKCGVVLGLENHWGLARTPEGLLKIHEKINSPWLGVTVDTGNFLEDPYDKIAKIAPKATHMHAKTYYGGGIWYALDLDYSRIAKIMRQAHYHGFVSLEFEGKEKYQTAIPKSLAVLRKAFSEK